MNADYKYLAVFAGCMILTVAVQAQDKSSLSRPGVSTNSPSAATMDVKIQPSVPWGDHMQVSGLLIDCVQPRQTWSLLNPAMPAPPLPPPQTQAQLQTQVPITPSNRDSDVENRGPNFAVLRFSFP
jgi:hypothetical protein